MTEDGIPLEWKLNLWLALGIPLAIGWLLVVAILVRPATRKGMAWWVLPVVAINVVAPVFWKLALWASVAFAPVNSWLADHFWILPVGVASILAAIVAFVAVRRAMSPDYDQMPTYEPEPPQIAAQPVQMWTAPIAPHQQWDSDSLNR